MWRWRWGCRTALGGCRPWAGTAGTITCATTGARRTSRRPWTPWQLQVAEAGGALREREREKRCNGEGKVRRGSIRRQRPNRRRSALGLLAAGYRYVNLDDCVVAGRYPNGACCCCCYRCCGCERVHVVCGCGVLWVRERVHVVVRESEREHDLCMELSLNDDMGLRPPVLRL